MEKTICIVLLLFAMNVSNAQSKESSFSGIKDKKHIEIGFSIPALGAYGQLYDMGPMFTLSADKYLNFKLPSVTKIGFNYGMSFNYASGYQNYFLINTELGLIFTYQFSDNMTIDTKLSVKPSLGNIGTLSTKDFNLLTGLRSGIGIFANIQSWRFGVEFSGGNMKFVNDNEFYSHLNSGRIDILAGFNF